MRRAGPYAAAIAAFAVPALSWVAISQAAPPPIIAAPADRPYPGEITVAADASDVTRRIVHVRERVTGLSTDAVLWYPKWLPGTHAPEGPIDRLAGLSITAAGKPLAWTRDTVNVYAFRLRLPPGTGAVDIEFDYLSPTSAKVGTPQMNHELLILEWNDVLLYPAGYYARQIPVSASLRLPAGWTLATALETRAREDDVATFARVSLEKLIDSPVIAGRHARKIELDAASGVRLDVFADRADLLEPSPQVLASHRALVTQAYKLFGARHFAHYDFLLALTEQIPWSGLEHHECSEDVTDANYFADWEGTPYGRDVLAHEYTHSWNGKFRRPADLWTANYEVPMRNSLLWVYEGQTQYWGYVLTARAGLWSRAEVLDALADDAAYYSSLAGRRWRPLQDTTNDEIINPRRPMSWDTWQRYEDYYEEGALFWLEADTLIRERSHGQRSLDDFAKRFFGVSDGLTGPVTYTFDDVVAALNAVEPYDWAAFLRQRVETVNHPAPLDGLKRGGYQLVYTDKPGDFWKARESQRKAVLLRYSLGLDIDDKDGTVTAVSWDGPAFKAGVTEGMQILAINGFSYSGDLLKRAITVAKGSTEPIVLILKNADRYVVANVEYAGGLRYPHLERIASVPALLDDILAARP
jgi:predicted metalloprotease with PDZ domain